MPHNKITKLEQWDIKRFDNSDSSELKKGKDEIPLCHSCRAFVIKPSSVLLFFLCRQQQELFDMI